MAITVEKISIALPKEMASLVCQVVETGEYTTSSKVIHESLSAWQHERVLRQVTLDKLRTAIQTMENIKPIIEKAKTRKQVG